MRIAVTNSDVLENNLIDVGAQKSKNKPEASPSSLEEPVDNNSQDF